MTNNLGPSNFYFCKTFKIEIQKGGPNNSDFMQNWFPQEIGFPKKLGRPSLISRNFKILKRVLLNHAECIEI